MNIIDSPSPNQSPRSPGAKIDCIVIHGTVGTDASDLSWLRTAKSEVSYHYWLPRGGAIHRMVRPEAKAWHAGASEWGGVRGVNEFSIGIGLSNRGPKPDGSPIELYTAAQYKSLGWLLATLRQHYRVPYERIIGHSNCSPGRKSDPWGFFEWGRMFSELHNAENMR